MPEEVLFRSAEPVKIKVERGQRGAYGWEIAIKGDDAQSILAQLVIIDDKLKVLYPQEPPKAKDNEKA